MCRRDYQILYTGKHNQVAALKLFWAIEDNMKKIYLLWVAHLMSSMTFGKHK